MRAAVFALLFCAANTWPGGDSIPPGARWTAPQRYSTERGDTIRIAVEAWDSGSGVAKAVFSAIPRDTFGLLLPKEDIGTVTTPPYEIHWDVSHICDQTFMKLLLFCDVHDSAGNVNSFPEGSRGGPDTGWYNLFVLDRNPLLNSARFVSRRARGRVIVDGNLGEWSHADSVVLHVNENRVVVRTLWDRWWLYFAVDARDTSVMLSGASELAGRPAGVSDADGIHFFFDPDHDHKEIKAIPDTYYIGLLGRRLRRVVIDTLFADFNAETSAKSSFRVLGTANDPTDRDTGWLLEASIPWADLEIERPHRGQALGFEIAVYDGDRFGASTRQVQWSVHAPQVRGNPSEWGNLVLEGPRFAVWAWILVVLGLGASAGLVVTAVRIRRPVTTFTIEQIEPKRTEIRKALDYIALNFGDPALSRGEVATHVALSVSRFGHLFKQECSMSFVTYLTKYRISRARLLLANTSRTVSQIVFEVGFQNPAYFSRQFRRETAMSPQEFRRGRFPGLT